MSDPVKHPLEELVEQWERRWAKIDEHLGSASAAEVGRCADQLRATLNHLWHRFDPNDETTWPTEQVGEYLTFDGYSQRVMEWGLWHHYGVTHYTELLPAPKGDT